MTDAQPRKINRGEPLAEEVTKGSSEYAIRELRRSFYRQFPDSDSEFFLVEETFADHVIVYSSVLQQGEYYRVTYNREEGVYTFAPRDEWEIVELSYRPQTTTERLQQAGGSMVFESGVIRLGEAVEGKPRYIYCDAAFADVINENGRRYPLDILVEAVNVARIEIKEGSGVGRAVLLGEEEHPSDKRQSPRLTETIVVWEDVSFVHASRMVKVKGRIVENSRGTDALRTMEAGVLPGVSLRGYGESHLVKEAGRQIEEILWLRFVGFDLVMNPGFKNAGVTALESQIKERIIMSDVQKKTAENPQPAGDPTPVVESKSNGNGSGAGTVDPAALTAVEIRKLNPGVAQQLMEMAQQEAEAEAARERAQQAKKLAELKKFADNQAAGVREKLGVGETDDLDTALQERMARLSELEAAEQKRAVQAFVEKESKDLKYPDYMREQFLEAVGTPATVEEAKATMTRQRAIFDKMLAGMRTQLKGFTGGIDMLGPVIERDGGIPAYAVAASFVAENLQLRREGYIRKETGTAPTKQDMVLGRYLEEYDNKYKGQMAEEARAFDEAEQTSDLNLPYSVMRAVIAEVYPTLITPVIFDYGLEERSPVNIYYERYVGEAGETVSITNEAVTADADAWVSLAHKRLIAGTVVVTNVGDTVTYVEGSDYVINYEDGALYALSTGAITDGLALLADYQYMAVREGEMAVIPRGKVQIVSQVLTQRADRLAQQISDEAVRFSRSQLGWDATARTLQALITELGTKIDNDRLRMALGAALITPNNSGGTWNSASDTLDKLVEMIGAAKVKVANRLYTPTGIVCSLTRSDTISNWTNFTAAGARADADLRTNGYIGRLKGLPVYESTQFPDNYILVFNRELVMQRVFRPMELKGPYQSYDPTTGQLIAADQFYVQEYNGAITPVPGKGSYVRIS